MEIIFRLLKKKIIISILIPFISARLSYESDILDFQ